MKTSRVTRRVVRRWAVRIRAVPTPDPANQWLEFVRLEMPTRERDVLFAMLFREIARRVRAVARG